MVVEEAGCDEEGGFSVRESGFVVQEREAPVRSGVEAYIRCLQIISSSSRKEGLLSKTICSKLALGGVGQQGDRP